MNHNPIDRRTALTQAAGALAGAALPATVLPFQKPADDYEGEPDDIQKGTPMYAAFERAALARLAYLDALDQILVLHAEEGCTDCCECWTCEDVRGLIWTVGEVGGFLADEIASRAVSAREHALDRAKEARRRCH